MKYIVIPLTIQIGNKMKNRFKLQAKNEKGFTLIELMVVMTIIGLIALAYAKIKPAAEFLSTKNEVTEGIDQIVADAAGNKGANPNYAGVDLPTLCANGYLNEMMCGEANDGVGTNPYGGDWTLTTSSTYGSAHLLITIDKIPSARFAELANIIAARSYKVCKSYTDCAAISVTEPSEDGADGSISVDI
ncbi:prepilin-type N-terminal cleavage/methylation domain-containing protein [Vibrio sp. S11_S32]|uniref:type II secretion system protein n=1 Tax=Vibrio sp. S11_S32 TaxID=2720225 RepID=UPI00167FE865|nr:prepilin-type N-terminal cleavage/methylation domain-containing protein [Vibrio sp. S11_S32]MBD1577095.1 prepilin-type N-terminal cleavage/methylation domain-containing protein [Vibrio sp. S11_S32]